MVKNLGTPTEGYVTERSIAWYKSIAEGMWGIIVTEATRIHPSGSQFRGMLAIWSDKHIMGHAELVDTIKMVSPKTLTCLQIVHGGHAARWQITAPEHDKDGVSSMSPSGLNMPWRDKRVREMSSEEVSRSLDWHADAAARAKEAGYDMVMPHMTHGFLLQNLMSPYFNRRIDKWGDPIYVLHEALDRIRSAVGPGYPICPRVCADEGINRIGSKGLLKQAHGGPDRDGITPQYFTSKILPVLEEHKVNWLSVTVGDVLFSCDYLIPIVCYPRGYFLSLAENVKKALKDKTIAVSVPGKIAMDPALMESIVAEGRVDMVEAGRPQFADHHIPKKIMEGKIDEITLCISCDQCTQDLFEQKIVRCAVNPEQAFEFEYREEPTLKPKNVVVIGGGPGGMVAATILARRGHKVTLFEKRNELGGQMALASRNRLLGDFRNAVVSYENKLKKLKVDVRLGQEAKPDKVKALKPDAIIVAAGSKPLIPKIRGVDKKHVLTEDEALLKGPDALGDNIVIIGALKWGVEMALWLADEGKKVAIIDEMPGIPSLAIRNWNRTFYYHIWALPEKKVGTYLEVKDVEITDKSVKFKDKEGKSMEVKADNVILAVDRTPNAEVYEAFKDLAPEVYNIGDSVRVGHTVNATQMAAYYARKI
jgi:2,4-dienoyl-CoA reductase-like NADH-dependent reductase (Old Yellow Enzyme family)/thioredoxin reductase